MNTLAYILLSVLLTKPMSGYELKQFLTLFWEAHHSQIYTTLVKLDKEDYVEVINTEEHSQKKIYRLTEKGDAAIHEWLDSEPPLPTQRDEFLAKIYALALFDQNDALRLISIRKEQQQTLLKKSKQQLAELDPQNKQQFGQYAIIKRRIMLCKQEQSWCSWLEKSLLELTKDEAEE